MSHEHEARAADAATRPRFWTCGKIVFVAALGVALSLVLALLVVRHRLTAAAHRAVEAELAKIRAKGEPVTPAELAPPAISDDENAAVIFKLAFAELGTARLEVLKDDSLADWNVYSFDEIEHNREKVEKVLRLHAETLRLAREALARPRCRFDLNYAAGFEMDMSHVPSLRALAELMKVKGSVHAHAGRPEEAARSFLDALRLARVLYDEPLELSKLVQDAILQIETRALQEAARTVRMPGDIAREIMSELARYECGRVAREAMLSERCCSIDAAGNWISGEEDFPGDWAGTSRGPLLLLLRFHYLRDEERMMRTMAEYLDAVKLPSRKALARIKLIDARIGALSESRAPLTMYLTQAWGSVYLRFVRRQARCDAARLGLACELFRSKRGRYPATLADLAPEFIPELPPDPFTGKEFKYVLGGKGAKGDTFVVYSVGENLVDDGGVRVAYGSGDFQDYSKGDIVWEGGSASRTGGEEGVPSSE